MEYAHARVSSVSVETAWQALAHMDAWLPTLDTIAAVHPDRPGSLLREGASYRVETPEGVTMTARVVHVDQAAHTVRIHAKAGPLRSRLTCGVRPAAAGCELSRSQAYPGLVGKLFTLLKGRREDAETRAYLDAWHRYALAL